MTGTNGEARGGDEDAVREPGLWDGTMVKWRRHMELTKKRVHLDRDVAMIQFRDIRRDII